MFTNVHFFTFIKKARFSVFDIFGNKKGEILKIEEGGGGKRKHSMIMLQYAIKL